MDDWRDMTIESKHLKLPRWLLDRIEFHAESQRRSLTQQVVADLEALYTSRPANGRTNSRRVGTEPQRSAKRRSKRGKK